MREPQRRLQGRLCLAQLLHDSVLFRPPASVRALSLGSPGPESLWGSTPSRRSSIALGTCVCPPPAPSARSHAQHNRFRQLLVSMVSAHPRNEGEALLTSPLV